MTDDRYESLAIEYGRLRAAARALVDDTRPAGAGRPMCAVPPHRVRAVRRELANRYEPQPSRDVDESDLETCT